MSKELIVSSTAHETKVGILENDELVEVYFEREKQHGLAGSIYKGRVTRVLPGMQSAFVDIGLERDAFLYVSDFLEDTEEYDRVAATVEEKVVRMEEKALSADAGAAGGEEPAPTPEPDEDAQPPSLAAGGVSAHPPRQERQDRPGSLDGSRPGRRHRRRRFGGGRGFPDSKFDSRPDPRLRHSAPPPVPRPVREDKPVREERPVVEAGPEAGFEVLPGESLARHSRPAEARAVPEAEVSGVQEIAAEPVEIPAEAEPLLTVAEEAEPEALDLAERQPAAEEKIEIAGDEEAEAEVDPEEGPAEVEAQVAAAPAPVEAEEPDEPQPPYPYPHPMEAAVRERPYGRRFLHRGQSRPPRRRDDRPEFRDRRPGDRQPPPARPQAEAAPPRPSQTSIADLLKQGQEVIVQIAKEPMGRKGARITSHIALPGRYLVYMPTVDHVGVSRKIGSEEERQRLRHVVQTHRVGMPGGFILRTAGEGQPDAEIRADMDFLYNLWLDLRGNAERLAAPALVHHDLNLVERILRDQLAEDYKTIWVDAQEDYERILQFVERFQPNLIGRVKLYTRANPIFDEFGITPELEKALRTKVWLKSGGYIVINQTEALVAIDVNTGKYVGKSNRLEDTIVQTNLDAVLEIVRQIRLRDLGGIIVVDFIDMDERKNRQKVMQTLDEALRRDRSPSKILQFNDFGLVAITRKRVKQSLERTLCSPCPYCDGAGFVKSVATMIQEILAEAKKVARTTEARDVTLRVNPEVARYLKSRNNNYLEEIEAVIGRPVLIRSDPQMHQEKFDLN